MSFDCPRKSLCPSGKVCTEKKMCTWGISLQDLLKHSRLPSFRWNRKELICPNEDLDAFTVLSSIERHISEWTDASETNNVLICGASGNGKTSWAIRLLQKYLIVNASEYYAEPESIAVFVPTVQFLSDSKSPFGSPFYERYTELAMLADKAELTVWDDIGRIRCTDYDYMHLFTALERRFLSGKCNIFTTNCVTLDEFADYVGEALADRVWNKSRIVRLGGRSRRGE